MNDVWQRDTVIDTSSLRIVRMPKKRMPRVYLIRHGER